ncbi:MAG: hypothetical protein DMG80_19690 [Acidobacteria bacterium]|nr:MAG: hypothetical protein DMG80_19690 [Acidobacteriota bacterium]
MHLLETFRDVDAGALSLQAALERVADLTLRIVGGDGAAVWLFTSEDLFCRAVAGTTFEDDHIRSVLRSKLKSAGAFGDDPPARLDLARTMADCLGGNGSWLVIAILPGRQLAGGLAVYSSQSAAFTSRDFVHLRLLAGLASYVATTAPKPAPVEDLYLPGLGTRAALGGELEEPSHGENTFRDRTDRLAALVSSAADIARESVVAGAQVLKETASTIGQASTFRNQQEKTTPPPPRPPESAHQLRSPRWLAARSSVSGPKVSRPAQHLSLVTDQLMKKLRRARFLMLKLIGDAREQMSSRWERLSSSRVTATVQFRTEARQEVRLWGAQWSAASARGKVWIGRYFAAAVNRLTSLKASKPTVGRPTLLPRSSPSSAGHSRSPLQSLMSSAQHHALAGRHHLRSASSKVGRTIRSARQVEVNWTRVRKAAPAIVVLAVMFLFVVAQIPATKSLTTISETPATVSQATITTESHLTLAAAISHPQKPAPVPTETSHLKVTDRATEATIAELSQHEVRNLPRAANYGDDEAAFQMGMLYEVGLGVTQNCTKAAEWVAKAAQTGNAAAEYNLALRYRDGDGVAANADEAERWFRKAGLHKTPSADHVLAALPGQDARSVRQ